MSARGRTVGGRTKRLLVPVMAMGTVSGGVLAVTTAAPAHAATANVGYACALWSNVSLFDGPYGSQGCGTQTSTYATANSAAPSVTLPSSGAYTALTDSDGAKLVYGPAVIVSSPYDANDNTYNTGSLNVYTYATSTNTYGGATSRALGPSPFWTKTPTSWQPASSEGYAKATCSSTSTSNNASVEIKNGVVDTKLDPDTGYPVSQVLVPNNPAPGYRVDFTIDTVSPDEKGYIVFNERVVNADGSMTTNAAHMYMLGPIAKGEVIYSQVRCGHI